MSNWPRPPEERLDEMPLHPIDSVMEREAARFVSSVGAVIGLLIAFGVPITTEQSDAILKVVLIAGPLVMGELIRRRVWSAASVDEVIQATEEEVRLRAAEEASDYEGYAPSTRAALRLVGE